MRGQGKIIFRLMADGKWRTLKEIEAITKFPITSISARLREMRMTKFGGHKIEKRLRGKREYEYRLIINFEGRDVS